MFIMKILFSDDFIAWKFLHIIYSWSFIETVYRLNDACESMNCLQFDSLYSDIGLIFCFAFMAFNAIFYLILGLYLEEIIPQPNSSTKHPLFFLNPIFKIIKNCFKKLKVRPSLNSGKEKNINENNLLDDPEVARLQKEILNGTIHSDNHPLLISAVSKNFKGMKRKAVDNMFLAGKKNQCFGLLGRNGAGKSTLIKMISNSLNKTEGKIIINGKTNTNSKVRESFGITPQDNIFFPDLTATEHLVFYLKLKKDVSLFSAFKQAKELMTRIGLTKLLEEKKQNSKFLNLIKLPKFINYFLDFFSPRDKIGNLSGGMKRLTQIAISLVGDPSLVCLDEPCRAIDYLSKKKIWELILKEKKKRTILLTTHSMEEADLLCDEIGIMSNGKLIALGDSLTLKERYGKGYQIKVLAEKIEGGKEKCIDYIKSVIPTAKIDKNFGNLITYRCESLNIPNIFNVLEKNKKENCIVDWELNETTLQDVFLSVNEKASELEIEDEKAEKKNEKKEIELKEKQNETKEEEEEINEKKKSHLSFCGLFLENIIDTIVQSWVLLKKNSILMIKQWPFLVITMIIPFLMIFFLWGLFALGNLNFTSSSTIQNSEFANNEIHKCKPWFDKNCYELVFTVNGNSFGRTVLTKMLNKVNISYLEFDYSSDMKSWIFKNPNITTTAIDFSNITSLPGIPNYIHYDLYFNTTTLDQIKGDADQNVINFQILLDETILQEATGDEEKKIQIDFKHFPLIERTGSSSSKSYSLYSGTGPMMISMPFTILFSILLYYIVQEKENMFRDYLKSIGMKNPAYWISWYILFIIFSIVYSLIVIFSGYLFQIPMFLYTDFTIQFLLYFLFSLSLVSLVFAFSSITSSTKGVISIIVLVIFGIVMVSVFFEQSLIYSFWADPDDLMTIISAYFIASIFSPFCFSKIYADIFVKTVPTFDSSISDFVKNDGYWWPDVFVINPNTNDLLGDTPPSFIFFLLLLLNIFIYFIISCYLDNVFSNGLSFFHFLFPSYWFPNTKLAENPKESIDNNSNTHLDDDIKKEIEETRNFKNHKNILRILNFSKTFKKFFFFSKVKAVKNLSICAEAGTIFSLLGKNGSGKTTTINGIKGSFVRSMKKDEDIIIDNKYSIKSNISNVRKRLGICNQFDNLIPEFTPLEHLKLVGEMKRVPRKRIKILSKKLLNEVGLWHVRNKRLSKFSGGMKRRVTLCLSLIAQDFTKILCIDEPSEELDPKIKMENVWKLLWKYKKNRALILTSHSMEEVQFLSDKIAILVKGELKAVGNSVFLKQKYKTGYNLRLIFAEKSKGEDKYAEFEKKVLKILPEGSKLVEKHDKMFQFLISHEKIENLGKSLEKIEQIVKGKDPWITKYGVSCTTLEDVFIKVNEEVHEVSKKIIEEEKVEENNTIDEKEEVIYNETQLSIEIKEKEHNSGKEEKNTQMQYEESYYK